MEACLAQRRRRSYGGSFDRCAAAGAGFLREGLGMAKTIDQHFDNLRGTRVWRSIFRSGTGGSTLKRALAIQQNVFLHLFSTKVRTRMMSFSATWYLGTLTLGTFFILIATGIPLMFYYHPSAPQAYADTKDLQFVVSSGLFLRNLHRWSAHAMVFLVFAHMFKVFYRGAYRTPREFNWVIGVVLLLITLLLSYTGYLLPWDQLAYWAVTVVLFIAVHFWRIRKDGGIYPGESAAVESASEVSSK